MFNWGKKRDDHDESRPLARSMTEAQLVELRETAREWIGSGFRDKDDLPTELADYHDDFDVEPDAVLGAAREVVEHEWAIRLAEQQAWSGDSDYAKVSRAFAELGQQGIVARMNFACCQTCGTTEIDDERTPVPQPSDAYAFREWGYTFFHQQDAERLVDSPASLYLSYSAFTPAPGVPEELIARFRAGDEAATAEVGRLSDIAVGTAVVEALRAEGLDVEWNGSGASRIQVTITDWRKPLPVD